MAQKKNSNSMKLVGIVFILISIFIGFRIYRNINKRPFPTPRETNINLIQSWMTLDYISKTYDVPMPEIKQNLEYKFDNSKVSIEKVSKDNKVETQKVINKLQNIITNFQNRHQKPPQK